MFLTVLIMLKAKLILLRSFKVCQNAAVDKVFFFFTINENWHLQISFSFWSFLLSKQLNNKTAFC